MEIHGLRDPLDAYQRFTMHSAALAAWETLACKGYVELAFGVEPDYPTRNELESCTQCGDGHVM
jgi:hypothetical protein